MSNLLRKSRRARVGFLRRIGRSTSGRWSFVVLAALALSIQGLVVQPHIHAKPAGQALAGVQLDSAGGSGNPLDQDQNDCPMCQSAHQGGHYLKPAAAVFAPSLAFNYRRIEPALLPAVAAPPAHTWHGRAPPQA